VTPIPEAAWTWTTLALPSKYPPSGKILTKIADPSDLEEVYNTERQLLYVACTRARDSLLVTGVIPASEFLDDVK
jgi:superfamily I DNA/RNA helicase